VNFEHIQTGTLREYLLRTVSDKEAEAIEDRYFADSTFFKQLRAAEVELICDYLGGRLNQEQRERFQSRYLQVQTLRELVDEVRSRRDVLRRSIRNRMSQVALVGALGCAAVVGFAIVWHNRAKTAATPAPIASVERRPEPISLVLSPGVTKGGGSSTPILTLSNSSQNVSLVAELPGQSSAAIYTARVLNVDLEGLHREIWVASGLKSTLTDGVQSVIVELPSASISSGDYILKLETKSSRTTEAYVFRVIRSHVSNTK